MSRFIAVVVVTYNSAEQAEAMVASVRAAELGPWDESYFPYSEETEFCLRVRDAGHRLVCAPGAIAEHVGG